MSYVYAHLQTPAQFCKSKLYNFLCQNLERSFISQKTHLITLKTLATDSMSLRLLKETE